MRTSATRGNYGAMLRPMTTTGATLSELATRVNTRRRSAFVLELRGVYIIWYRDLLRWWRDRARILPSLVQPLLYLFVFGLGLGSAIGGGAGGRFGTLPGVGYMTFMYPGVLAM